ncbi:MAG: hypothetical protein KAI24_12920, partial [Planctomycetes bacterium]|nr:hypothetical protein [Planctomycetota bacterium]
MSRSIMLRHNIPMVSWATRRRPALGRVRSAAPLGLLVAAWLTSGVTAQCDAQWLPGGGVGGLSTIASAVVEWDPDGGGPALSVIVAGGGFEVAGAVIANFVASYDAASGAWAPLSSVMNGTVHALTTLPNGDLVAGGSFTTAGGVTSNRIARWNGAAWSPLGTGFDGEVHALATLANGDVVAAGRFATAGGV